MRIAPVDPQRVQHASPDDRHADADDDRDIGTWLGTDDRDDRHPGHAGETDNQCRYTRGQAEGLAGKDTIVGCQCGRRCDHEQAGIPRQIERAARSVRAAERDDGVDETPDCQRHDTGQH